MSLATINSVDLKPPEPKIDSLQASLDEICSPDQGEIDDMLRLLSREDILNYSNSHRLRWFYLVQVKHFEFNRVLEDVAELLEPSNEVKIISLIGMTGIGKTTLASKLLLRLIERYSGETKPNEVPVIFVKAPANGDRSLSWSVLYRSMLNEGQEVLLRHKRGIETTPEGEMRIRGGTRAPLAELREFIDSMLRNRNVRVVVIDEALHLLRFANYGATMDTLKSLAESYGTKLILIGNYDIADLVSEYGQVCRRGEIIHYQRYKVGLKVEGESTNAQTEFRRIIGVFQRIWPNKVVPNLMEIWYPLMKASLGSVGLLKIALLRLAMLQAQSSSGKITDSMLRKATKSPKSLQKIEEETINGEERLKGACYGDSLFSDDEIEGMICSMGVSTGG